MIKSETFVSQQRKCPTIDVADTHRESCTGKSLTNHCQQTELFVPPLLLLATVAPLSITHIVHISGHLTSNTKSRDDNNVEGLSAVDSPSPQQNIARCIQHIVSSNGR